MKRATTAILLLASIVFLVSCDKDQDGDNPSVFYGAWKTSYGDTIVFLQQDNKNIVRYNASMNPSMPMHHAHEYNYNNGKFYINRTPADASGLQELTSFQWLDRGRSFQLQGMQWFMFLASTQTQFTFTKIL